MEKVNDHVKDLNLLLLYLSGWEEDSNKDPNKKVYRAWKGFLFDVLNELKEEDLIQQLRKSVLFTEKGIVKAKELKEKYLRI